MIDDIDIIARIEQEEGIAYGINDSELSAQRAQAIDYYLGEPYGNEVEGRSQVVTTEVQDTIESALPQLLKIFVSGDQVVNFKPRGPEDIDASEQETEYVNYVVMEKNPGYKVFYTWFKDALLSKNGYVKVYYEEENETEEEQYKGLTDAQLQMLLSDQGVELLEHEAYPDPSFQAQPSQQSMMMAQTGMPMPPPPMLHDVKIAVSEDKGCIRIDNVSPENIMVSVDAHDTCMQSPRFIQHREIKTRAELEEEGFTVPDNLGYTEDNLFDTETIARDLYSERNAQPQADEILVKDTYIRIDGERWRVVVAGNTVLLKEKTELVPFCCITPMLMPHRHIGRSYADLTISDQLVGSTLLRGMLDAMYLANQPRYAISDRVNLEDMLVSRPGGVVRVKGEPTTAIQPLLAQPASPYAFKMIELMNSNREKRTGVTSYNQGLDSESLNKTATGMQIITNAAQERLLNVARLFAETGVKDLFLMVHRLVRMNYTKPDIVRLRNEWVEVDPRQWKTRTDLSISVGLGTGNKDQQLGHLMSLLQIQREALQIGVASPENIFYAAKKVAQNAGFKDADSFFTDPAKQPQQQQQPDPEMMKMQGQMQMEQQKLQATAQIEQQKAQAQLQQEQLRSQNDIAIEREKIAAQMELERYKAQLQAQTQLEIARMNQANRMADATNAG